MFLPNFKWLALYSEFMPEYWAFAPQWLWVYRNRRVDMAIGIGIGNAPNVVVSAATGATFNAATSTAALDIWISKIMGTNLFYCQSQGVQSLNATAWGPGPSCPKKHLREPPPDQRSPKNATVIGTVTHRYPVSLQLNVEKYYGRLKLGKQI